MGQIFMLSKAERKYLNGVLKPKPSYERKLQTTIRAKLRSALQDLGIVAGSPIATKFSSELAQLAALLSPYLSLSYNQKMVDRGGLEPPTSPSGTKVPLHLEEFREWCLKIRKVSEDTTRHYVSYVKRFWNALFNSPESLTDLPPKKRNWIVSSFYAYMDFLDFKTVEEYDAKYSKLKAEINSRIQAYGINRDIASKSSIQIVPQNKIREIMKKIGKIGPPEGPWFRFLLYTGLREEEAIYIKKNWPLPHETFGDIAFITVNYIRKKKKCYYTLVPTDVLNEFLNAEDVPIQDLRKIFRVKFKEDLRILRKIHLTQLMKTFPDSDMVEALQGRTKSVRAKHYAIYVIDEMLQYYRQAWGLAKEVEA